MAKAKPSDVSYTLTEEVRRELVVRFLAEVMQMTGSSDKQEDFQAALQAYCNSLQPWLEPSDGPPNPRSVFSLLDSSSFDDSGEHVTVVLSAEAEALFRAWLRRNKIWDNAGLHTVHAWSN